MSKNFAVTADGVPFKEGDKLFYGEHKVRVLSILPADYAGRRVEVSRVGFVHTVDLYKSKTGQIIV